RGSIPDQPNQPHGRACAGTDGAIWGRLANSSSNPAYFQRSESRELGISNWALQLVSPARPNRAHSQRIAQCGIASAFPTERLLPLALILISNSTDKRIRLAFGPDFGRRSVTGQNCHVVAERKKFLPDSTKQKIDISAGQVPASAAGQTHTMAGSPAASSRS